MTLFFTRSLTLLCACIPQEITYNPDGNAVAPPYNPPPVSWIEAEIAEPDIVRAYKSKLDMSMHTGTKDITSNGLRRMMEFNEWLFNANSAEMVVAVGHSLWFKSYFNEFLPRRSDATVKKKKLPNCGMVEFVVECVTDFENNPVYLIDASSIKTLKA